MHRPIELPEDGGDIGLSAHAMFVILFGSAMTIMASATISPSLPGLRAHFSDVENVDTWVRLILTMPSLTVALTAIMFGLAIDEIGRKPFLIGAIVVYGLAGVSGFFLDSISGIVLGRALLGISKAALLTVCTTLVADCFSGNKLRQIMGVQSAAIKFGGIVLIFSAGFLADLHWRWPFLLYGAVLLTLIGAITDIPETKPFKERQKSRLQLGQWPAASIAVAAMILVVTLITQAVFYQLPLELPFYIVRELEGNGAQIGIALSTTALVAGTAGLLYGQVKAALGFNSVFAISFAAYALGMLVMSQAESYSILLLGVSVLGLGLGLVVPNVSVWMVEVAPAVSRGFAISIVTMVTFLGQFASTFFLSPLGAAYGIRASFVIMAIGCFVLAFVFLLAIAVPAFRKRSQPQR